ncbi:MAG: hypothetical protein SFU25_05640 [Candidatus Caenarcaniphilales bacterium]|nr:hypothetical protein [Candidatus Caenarcaniphilales bacterium]
METFKDQELINQRFLKLEERMTIGESKISQALEWLEDLQDDVNSRK